MARVEVSPRWLDDRSKCERCAPAENDQQKIGSDLVVVFRILKAYATAADPLRTSRCVVSCVACGVVCVMCGV